MGFGIRFRYSVCTVFPGLKYYQDKQNQNSTKKNSKMKHVAQTTRFSTVDALNCPLLGKSSKLKEKFKAALFPISCGHPPNRKKEKKILEKKTIRRKTETQIQQYHQTLTKSRRNLPKKLGKRIQTAKMKIKFEHSSRYRWKMKIKAIGHSTIENTLTISINDMIHARTYPRSCGKGLQCPKILHKGKFS